jgi:hypothetical protein
MNAVSRHPAVVTVPSTLQAAPMRAVSSGRDVPDVVKFHPMLHAIGHTRLVIAGAIILGLIVGAALTALPVARSKALETCIIREMRGTGLVSLPTVALRWTSWSSPAASCKFKRNFTPRAACSSIIDCRVSTVA